MSEELKKRSAFDIFAQVQQTYSEAEEKAKLEAGAPKVERFRIGEDGEYSIRVLPLAPSFDEDGNVLPMDRKGYEYPIHQLFLAIDASKKAGKKKTINIPVIRTTDKGVGMSIDLIDTYVKIAKEMYGDDEDLMKLITGNSYSGGLRWNYQHAMMVLDVSSDKERAKGPQLWQCSHSQYKDIDDAKMRLWRELREEDENATCPISSLNGAYPVKVIRGNNNGKTEYTIEIGRKVSNLKEEEVEKLLELPRIPEQIFRYTKYQLEATVVYLQQYDEKHDMEVCKEPDFIAALEQIKGELPADDNSHFDLAGAASKEGGKDEVTINSLWDDYDNIADQDLGEKSEEYQELREKIRQFIEDNNLDVRISRTKKNGQLLEEIEEAMDSAQKAPASKKSDEEEERPVAKKKAPKNPVVEEAEEDEGDAESDEAEDDDDSSEDDAPAKKDDDHEDEPREKAAAERATRRRRPTAKPVEDEEDKDDVSGQEEGEEKPAEEKPQRRLHARRAR